MDLGQLRTLGLGASGVRARVRCGRLHRLHRGVYAVGHRLVSERGIWRAAVLAYGPSAALSHRSVAALWGLRADNRDRTDVSLAGPSGRSRPSIAIHRCATLLPEDVTTRYGIRCTTPARTLLDLAGVLEQRELDRAVEQAEVLRLFDLRAVEDVLARANGLRGSSKLRRALEAAREPALTESELEEEFLELCRANELPRPEPGVWLATSAGHVKADFLWRAERLVVETDGYHFHSGRRAFERDHRRDHLLNLADWKVRRFTWRQVTGDRDLVAATVRAALAE